ncbi:MAG: hypothetical protein ACXWW1_06525, partial [Aeromicrobium sp.]
EVGDLEDAYRHLAVAEASAARWEGAAWPAAVLAARAHVALAEGQIDDAMDLSDRAANLFRLAGHHREAERCSRIGSGSELHSAGRHG